MWSLHDKITSRILRGQGGQADLVRLTPCCLWRDKVGTGQGVQSWQQGQGADGSRFVAQQEGVGLATGQG